MGDEARCTATWAGRTSAGRAHLEDKELVFRGDFRLAVRLADVTSAEAVEGWLRLAWGDDSAAFELGPAAAKWARKITHPKSLIDKLGVKPEAQVLLVDVGDEGFVADLKERSGRVATGRSRGRMDIIFFGAEHRDDLAGLERLRKSLKPQGAIWVIRPKGVKHITEAEVLTAGKAAGLVDVKVARFSDTHTAEKFVIPVADR
ncbi:MAG: DUF3052 family protein [Actinobacteria bacterium]|nr:DUF3052 family protein [Actinomycetota bacterium]